MLEVVALSMALHATPAPHGADYRPPRRPGISAPHHPGTTSPTALVAGAPKLGVLVHMDTANVDFHIDAALDHDVSHLVRVLDTLGSLGYHPLDDGECEPELLDDGSVRIYLSVAA